MRVKIDFDDFPQIDSQAHLENLVRMVIRQTINPDYLPASLNSYDPKLKCNPDLFQAGMHEALHNLQKKPDATPGELYEAIKGRLIDEINAASEYFTDDNKKKHYLRPHFIGTGSDFQLEKTLNERVYGRKVPNKFTPDAVDHEAIPTHMINTKPFTSLDQLLPISKTERNDYLEEVKFKIAVKRTMFDLFCPKLIDIWHKKDKRLKYWPYPPPPEDNADFQHIVDWDLIERTDWPNIINLAKELDELVHFSVNGIDKNILELWWKRRLTLIEIAAELNLHRTTVSRRLNCTIAKLKKYNDQQKKMRHFSNF